jgi:hypothetical protein
MPGPISRAEEDGTKRPGRRMPYECEFHFLMKLS